METHSDNQPATKGDLRHLEKHTDTRIDALKAHTDTRIDSVETSQAELRADFRSSTSAKVAAAATIFSALIGGAVGAVATYMFS